MRKAIVIIGVVLIIFVLIGSLALQLSGVMPRFQVGQDRAWDVPLGGGEVETLKTIDLTGDGEKEIFAQTPAQVAVISPSGQLLFSQNVFNAKSTMGDLNGDGLEDFVVAQPEGADLKAAAYAGDGTPLWEQRVPGIGAPTRGLTLDFEGDGAREVVFGTEPGVVVCLGGTTGELRWRYTFPPDTPENLYVRGADDAWYGGQLHLAAAVYGGHAVLLDGVGTPVWEREFLQPVRRLRAYDMDGDGTSEILLGGLHGLVWLISAAGDNPLWETSIGSRVDEARFLEVDGDPTQTELVVGGKNGGVSAYSRDGATLWGRSVAGKVRELATLDYDDDGQNEVLVAADKVYLLSGRTGDLLATFPVADPSILEVGNVGGERGYLVGAGGGVTAFQMSRVARPWWYSPITVGLLLALFIAAATVILARLNWEQTVTYTVQDKSPEALRARKKMLREVLDDTERVYRDGQISADVYLVRVRQERERLAAVEEQIMKLQPNYQPEVARCPACAAPLEIGLDRCPYCNHVLL